MSPPPVLSDAGPIIALGKLNHLSLEAARRLRQRGVETVVVKIGHRSTRASHIDFHQLNPRESVKSVRIRVL